MPERTTTMPPVTERERSSRANPFVPPLDVCRWLLRDQVLKRVIRPAGRMAGYVSRLAPQGSRRRKSLALTAQRYAPSPAHTRAVRAAVLGGGEAPFAGMIPDDVGLDEASSRSIVLKAPSLSGGRVEPGVLLVTFTNTNRYYFHHVDLARLQEHFCVVLEPSWAGYALPEVLCWTSAPKPVIVQSSETTDRAFLASLGSNLVPVDFGASDWVDHRIFRPLGLEPTYDAVYVANYSAGKRVHVFLKAVRELAADGGFRAALVCARWGGERETVHKLIDYYGVGDSIDLFEDATSAGVNALLNSSKCNVLLSLKEGSNRSLFEAMFAGTPAVLLRENVGVNKAYINAETGMLTPEAGLADALRRMKSTWSDFEPRSWAMRNIAPAETTKKLAKHLDRAFPDARGTFDHLLVKRNAPEVRYFDDVVDGSHAELTRAVLEAFGKGGTDPARVREAVDYVRQALAAEGSA